jgi:hypothetical protein
MEVATPKFMAKWWQEENQEEQFCKRVASMPDHLQYAEPLLWLDYKSMRNIMINLISNHKHFMNMKREAKKVVAFTMFYIRVPPPKVLLVFQVLATIRLRNGVTTSNSKWIIVG